MVFRKIFALLVIGLLLPASDSYCQRPNPKHQVSAFQQLKTEYLRLRNTDVQIAKVSEWEELARKFETFVNANPKSPDAPSGLYNASILYEQLFRRIGGSDRLAKSMSLLRRMADEYPADSMADDALVREGDFYLFDLNDPRSAEASYRRVLESFSGSDMLDAARIRLRSIQSGEYKAYSAPIAAEPEPQESGRRVLVVLDPGHGGEDFGAKGRGGLLEKDVTLAIALELEKLLSARSNLGVRLTRRRDVFVPLAERIQFANDFEADLFVSLHTNASPKSLLSGLETYYLDNTGDEASRLLAERENAGFQVGTTEGDLQFMLGDLIQNAKLEESIVLSHLLQRSLIHSLRTRYDSVRDLGVRKAPFYVLVGAHMPCALVELFFIDNSMDGVQLGRKEFRKEIASGLERGILAFLERKGLLTY